MAHTIKNEIFQWIKELTVLSFFRKIEGGELEWDQLEGEAHEGKSLFSLQRAKTWKHGCQGTSIHVLESQSRLVFDDWTLRKDW